MSLTKATLLKKTQPSKPDRLGEFFGLELYVKPISELQRSRRMAAMYDSKKEMIRPEAMQRARALTIIDHICDENGDSIFTDKDINDVMTMESHKVDLITSAIEAWLGKREKKLLGK